MSEYRVISEPYRSDRFSRAALTHRRLRGDDRVERLVTTVDAPDMLVAITRAIEALEHRTRNITSIEEIVPAGALYFTDAELTAVLAQPGESTEEPVDIDLLFTSDYPDDEVLHGSATFTDTVKTVAKLLGRTLVPGLNLTVVYEEGLEEYAIVEIRDAATRNYLSTSEDLSELIQDRTATGWNGILSIAKALTSAVSHLV